MDVAHLNETQVRLLDAAELLFAEQGFEAVSVRDITQAAEANVAAVNYHFGGKENLINAVMGRHAMPINAERILLLDALLERDEKPTIREVLNAFLCPMTERILEQESRQQLFAKFISRMMGEGSGGLPPEVLPQFQEMARKVVAGFQAAVPGLTEEEAYFRLKFCFAVIADALMRDEAFEQISEGHLPVDRNWSHIFEDVLDFCVGGFEKVTKKISKIDGCSLVLIFAMLFLVSGCGSGTTPGSQMDAIVERIPGSWSASKAGRAGVDENWVSRFGDRRLRALVSESLRRNSSIKSARERVNRAVILAKASQAPSLPQASVGLSGNRSRQVFVGFPIPGAAGPLSTLSTTLGASLDVSWEPDIWGKVSAAQSAELARLGAEENAFRAARASLAGQVVKAWLALGEAHEQLALARESLEIRKRTEEAIEDRFARSLGDEGGTAAQLRLARTDSANTEGVIAQWKAEVARAQRQLELLAGRYPVGSAGEGVTLPKLPSKPPTGLPSELLQRRPDVLEAERKFAAARKDTTVADLARFPSFSLTSSAGRTSSELGNLLDSDFGVWSLGANIVAPILSGGRLQADLESAGSRERSALADLQGKVLSAFGEVEQALVADSFYDQRVEAGKKALVEAKEAEEASSRDYASGVDTVLTVLQARSQRTQIASQLVTLRRQRLQNRVDLHLALGGDFQVRSK